MDERDLLKRKCLLSQCQCLSFLTLSNKVEKCLGIWLVCLSVCLSVCTRSNFCKYSSNILKFIYVIQIWHSMSHIKNGIHTTNGLSTKTHKCFPIHYGSWGKISKKRILTYLDCTKNNEIDISHSNIQKHVSYKKWYKMY